MAFKKNTHCILLYQIGATNMASRSFSEYESVTELVEGVISIFEDYYKATNPTMAEIEYDLASVVQFVDAIHDLSCLVYNARTNMYCPYDKRWIMEKLHNNYQKELRKASGISL